MRKSLWIDLIKLALIFAAIWGLFTVFPIFFPIEDTFKVSIETEEQLGKLIVDNLMEQEEDMGKKNPLLDSAMNVIEKRLLDNIGPTEYEYHIRVIDNPDINAFTLPGGNIFIFSGLIEFSEHPEEVAAVLAHEIGHAENRHVVSRLVKDLGITILFSVLTGGDAVVISEIVKTATSTAFDREQEKEADDFSFQLMEKSKINPIALATFFRRVNEKHGDVGENLELLMTHPNNQSRIKAALAYKVQPGFKSESFNMDWTRIKASITKNEDQ